MRLRLVLPVLALFSMGACIYRPVNYHPPIKKKCDPNQYWDGTQCRHKGKGKGARKHDD